MFTSNLLRYLSLLHAFASSTHALKYRDDDDYDDYDDYDDDYDGDDYDDDYD
jgi:hypothetical protein